MPVLLVLGASSDIAMAVEREFASHGWDLLLACRNRNALAEIAVEFSASGIRTECLDFDALESGSHGLFWSSLPCLPDAVLCAVGLLGDQNAARHDTGFADIVLRSNFTGLVPVLSMAADAFERRGSGSIMVISSVAGDRGRASNYVYGSAKAGMTAFLSGLRQRLCRRGVHVMTVKPGYVATAMTAHKKLPPLLTADPKEVGKAVYKAFLKRRDVIYTGWYWRPILFVARLLPEWMFKRIPM